MVQGRPFLQKFIAGLVIAGIIAGGYFLFHHYRHQMLSAEKAIPADAVFYIEWNDAPGIYDNLRSGNRIWEWLIDTEIAGPLNDRLEALDSLPGMNDILTGLLRHNKFVVSAHIAADSVFSFLYLLSLDDPSQQKPVAGTLADLFHAEPVHTANKKDNIFLSHEPVEGYYFTIKAGILLVSENLSLVHAAIDQIDDNSGVVRADSRAGVVQDAGFQRLQATAGKKVDGNIYMRHQYLGTLLSKIIGTTHAYSPAFFSRLATLTELDLIIKSEELLINGYTYCPDTSSYYFNTLKGQAPQEITMPMILPYNTRQMLWVGLQQPETYFSAFDKFISGNLELAGQWEENPDMANLYREAFTWLGNEMAVIYTVSGHRGNDDVFAVLKVSGGQDPGKGLSNISDRAYSVTINGHAVNKLKDNACLNNLLGHACNDLRGDYYTRINDYMVFASSTESLKSFINTFESGTTLDINENYKEFSDNISDRSNLYLYINIRNSLPNLSATLSPSISSLITGQPDAFRNMQAAGIQFSIADDLLYTNVYLKYNEAYKEEDRSVWKITLDAEVQGKPYLVWDHRVKKHKIIAFDRINNMYLLDHYGNIIWKIPIAEPPISTVYQVDYYNNGKIQYLFNTQNYLYLIDLKGRKVDNYPIKLNKPATSGMALFDYNGKQDYRLLIPTSDKKVYNYNIKGRQITGWINPKLPDIVTTTPQHLSVNKKDYILLTDENGKFKILNRKGKTRINLDKDFNRGQNSRFYINKTNSKGIIITTGSNGHLVYISSKGKTQETVFDEFSPGHYFLYDDFNRNGHNDFIFIDKGLLIVFNRFKKVIFTYSFEGNVDALPEMIKVPGNEKLLGVVCEGTVYLFDRHGNVKISAGLVGSTPFSAGYLNDDKSLNLIVGKGRTLFNYKID